MSQRPFHHTVAWRGPATDPNDVQFGDLVAETTLEHADDYDAVLVGEPYDGAVIGRRGARKGPEAIREQLAETKTHHFDAGPVGGPGDDPDGIGDLGNVRLLRRLQQGDRTVKVTTAQERVEAVTEQVHDTDALPVFLGGDNSMSVPNVRPLLDEGSVGVVSLDAHLDCRERRHDATSGTPYRQLYEAGLDGFAVLGARHFETSTVYHDYVREQGGEVVTAEEVGADPVAAADRALDALGEVDHCYVSLDVDVLDVTAAPAVSAPTPGGLTSREVFRLLRLLAADERLAGFEVVECAPRLADDDRTATTAARAIAHVLAAVGAEGGGRGEVSDDAGEGDQA